MIGKNLDDAKLSLARFSFAAVAALALTAALACSQAEEAASDVTSAASDAASAAADAASDAANAAADAASDAASAAADAASDAADAASDLAADVAAAADSSDTDAERCLALADDKNWTDALTPCSKAAIDKPGDLAIRHALQQAQAAAAEGS